MVIWCLALFLIIGYLGINYGESENEKLSSMTENEKQEYYQAKERREASKRLDSCQTAAHSLIRKAIKNSLKDPSSYRETSHKYYTNAIEVSYNATNSFGGRVNESYRYHFEPDVCGKNSSVEKIQ